MHSDQDIDLTFERYERILRFIKDNPDVLEKYKVAVGTGHSNQQDYITTTSGINKNGANR